MDFKLTPASQRQNIDNPNSRRKNLFSIGRPARLPKPVGYGTWTSNNNVLGWFTGDGSTTPEWTRALTGEGLAVGVDTKRKVIYASDTLGNLTSVNISDGSVNWSILPYTSSDQLLGPTIAVDNNGYIYLAVGNGNRYVKKINHTDGSVIWESNTRYPKATSATFSPATNSIYVGYKNNSVSMVRFDADTGQEIWTIAANAGEGYDPIQAGETGPWDCELLPDGNNIAVIGSKWNRDLQQNENLLWIIDGDHGDISVQSSLDSTSNGGIVMVNPMKCFVSTDDGLYVYDMDGMLCCMSPTYGHGNPLGYSAYLQQSFIATDDGLVLAIDIDATDSENQTLVVSSSEESIGPSSPGTNKKSKLIITE